ncbi:MAG TPA: pimeloyl-ACP methyl ester esterase BioH [Gammaproteobacteria bacterium]|nr:pimeloyl-ACP methyl ester esterase BioH [Gammaproteobacteria bacterium]
MKLHARTRGSGPALVLLHGWGLHSGIWATLAPELARNFSVTCVDLPGHGRSPPLPATPASDGLDAWAEAVAAAVPPGAAWLGWSLGGQVALTAALAGHDVRQLVLVATTPRFLASPGWPCGMDPAVLAGFANGLAGDQRRTLRKFLALQLRGDRRAASLLQTLSAVLEAGGEADTGALETGLAILAGTDLRERLAGIAQPALVIAGERDTLTPPDAGRRLAAALPAGRFELLAGVAHAPFLAAPGRFGELLSAFLAEEAVS